MRKTRLDATRLFVCGNTGSGKSTYAKMLAEQMGCSFLEVSDLVKRLTNAQDRSDIGNLPDLDNAIIEAISQEKTPVIISGVRQPSILEAFPESVVVYVGAPAVIRQERLNSRADELDNVDLEKVDQFDKSLGVDRIPNLFAEMFS